MANRAYRYRLYPTPDQTLRLSNWVGAVRFIYNLALDQRQNWYQPGRCFNFATQGLEVTQLRAEVDWLRDAPSCLFAQALRDLDSAYRNWWSGAARAPTPRKRGAHDSMRFPQPRDLSVRRLSRRWGLLRIPKMGNVRVRLDRDFIGRLCNLTISRKAGQWFVAIQCEVETDKPAATGAPIGIDRGVTVFAALSTGQLIAPANVGRGAGKALARAQRSMARKVKGSNNRRRARLRVARQHQRVANARKDFLHKITTTIAKNHRVVVIEALKVQNMTRSAAGTVENPGRNVRQKAGLNRSILDQGWGQFRTLLAYKLEERGGRLIEVNPAYTSQTCSACGVIDADSRRDQRFACRACGHEAHADTNASLNILRRGTAYLPVEGSPVWAPDEAGTCAGAIPPNARKSGVPNKDEGCLRTPIQGGDGR